MQTPREFRGYKARLRKEKEREIEKHRKIEGEKRERERGREGEMTRDNSIKSSSILRTIVY